MALLDTIDEIQKRRQRVMNRRENQLAAGQSVAGMPVPKERLRAAMAYLDEIYKENRMKAAQQIEQKNRMAQAMQMYTQQEQMQQQPQEAPQQPQMPAQPLMGQMQAQPQQMPQQPPQGLLGGLR